MNKVKKPSSAEPKNPNALAVVAKSTNIQPPPSREVLLLAAAKALCEERVKQRDLILKQKAKAWLVLARAVRKYAAAKFRKAPLKIRSYYGGKTFELERELRIDTSDVPEIAPLYAEWNRLNETQIPACDLDSVKRELREANRRDPEVLNRQAEALLSHPGLKRKMVEAANKMLNRISPADKAAAIPA